MSAIIVWFRQDLRVQDNAALHAALETARESGAAIVPVFIHEEFITSAQAIPEPSSWMMMIAGFGLSGTALRRQRRLASA